MSDDKVSVTTTITAEQKDALAAKAESVAEGLREAVALYLAPEAEMPAEPEVPEPIVPDEDGNITVDDVLYVPQTEQIVDGPDDKEYPNDHQHVRGPQVVQRIEHGGTTYVVRGCYVCGKPMP